MDRRMGANRTLGPSRRSVRLAAGAVAFLVLISLGPGLIGAQTAIKHGQHFIGAVNGQAGQAVVYTVCAGPQRSGELGPLAGNQTMLVVEAPNGFGSTGLFSHIYAWFVPGQGAARPLQLTFTGYGVPVTIPTSVRALCSGTGKVEFSSCPYLAPCAAGWVPTYVHVRFENLAV